MSTVKHVSRGTTNGLHHGTQLGVPMRLELVTMRVQIRGDAGQVK